MKHRISNNHALALQGKGSKLHSTVTDRSPSYLAKNREKAMFLLDARGRIQYWSAPGSIAEAGNELVGQPIRQLMPNLPLRDKTPGYNIAFVRLSFDKDKWLPCHVRMPDETLLPAEVHLKTIPMERGFCLLGLARLREIGQEMDYARGAGTRILQAIQEEDRRLVSPMVPATLLMDFAKYQNERRAETAITLAS